MPIGPSELILNSDQSIYHLNLRPEDIAETIILVGDQNRVEKVSRYFDKIEVQKQRREFITHTGILNGKRISAVSTGIGTDNIDIVLNEIDALFNIDFETRMIRQDPVQLDFVRIGTSGAIQPDIPLDSFIMSEYAIGFDNVLHFYKGENIQHPDAQIAFIEHTDWSVYKSIPYVVASDLVLAEKFSGEDIIRGFTGSNVGFYGPQGRSLRLALEDEDLNTKLTSFEYQGRRITNLEMETSAIYGLSTLLGHRALSMNSILANRTTGKFSTDPAGTIDRLIRYCLEKLTSS
ncbi:MAG: nucleoside phosphorylase [Flavobacteriaceae bacterium]